MRWQVEHRRKFICRILNEHNKINRKDIMNEYGISSQQASADLQALIKANPELMQYDSSSKCYRKIMQNSSMTPEDKELIPCPFCGSETYFQYGSGSIIGVNCIKCRLSAIYHNYEYKTKESVMKSWNTRAKADSSTKLTEEEAVYVIAKLARTYQWCFANEKESIEFAKTALAAAGVRFKGDV